MASTDARPVPIKNTAYRAIFPILDADGDLVTGATGLDSEVSKDQGTFTDCTNEATEIATSSGMYYLDLTSTEMNADGVAVIVKTSSSGAKTTVLVFYPQELGDIKVDVESLKGTSWLTPGTAGTPDVNVKLWNGLSTVALPLVPATPGRTLVVDAAGLADANIVKVGPTGSGTAQTAGDIVGRIGTPAGASTAADIAAVKAETASIQADTNDMQTRIPAALGANGNMKADVRDFSGAAGTFSGGRAEVNTSHVSGVDATKLSKHIAAVEYGVTTSGSTTTSIIANASTGVNGTVPSSVDDHYNGRVMTFTSGTLDGQATSITDYVGSTQTFTVVALTSAPASGVTFVIS